MTDIMFETEEFANGYNNYPTLCPYGIEARYTHVPIGVGGMACQRCDFFVNKSDNIVKCKYVPVLQKKEKDNQARPWGY